MIKNRCSNPEGYATGLNTVRTKGGSLFLPLLALVSPQLAAGRSTTNGWESPFQAGRPDLVRDRLTPVPAGRCDHDPYNKCTFTAAVDYDRNGAVDTVRMMDGREVGALVVEFAGKPHRRPLTIASFKGRWTGSCYIEPDRADRAAVSFICPEASAATFKMLNGVPAVRWTGD